MLAFSSVATLVRGRRQFCLQFRAINSNFERMEIAGNGNSSRPNSTAHDISELSDNTVTFVVGFSILILFVILGMLASAFLCITLKKDPYLWEAERERQLQDQVENDAGTNCKERDKLAMMDEHHNQESTQI